MKGESLDAYFETAEPTEDFSVKSVLWQPLPSKTPGQKSPQQLAVECLADELFYGGAAGGGKSDLGLGLAFTQHQHSLILRRESTQLNRLMQRARDIAGDCLLKYGDGIWTLADGRIVEFNGCKTVEDKRNFQGHDDDLKVFDEVPEFLEEQYLFICGWMRTATLEQRSRVVACGNPPTTAEGEWVIRRWRAWLDATYHNPALPGEIRFFTRIKGEDTEIEAERLRFYTIVRDSIEGSREIDLERYELYAHSDGVSYRPRVRPIVLENGETVTPMSRTFIPASVDDNPYYAATGYKAILQNLPEPLRSQMLYGNFQAGIEDNPYQVIASEDVYAAQKRYLERLGRISDGLEQMPRLTGMGVDVARGGRDETILCLEYEDIVQFHCVAGKLTPDGQSVVRLLEQYLIDLEYADEVNIVIDVLGVGSSAYDLAKERWKLVYGYGFGSGSSYRDKSRRLRCANKRAEAYWQLREQLDTEYGAALCLPPDSKLVADLVTPRYIVRGEQIFIEKKDEIKKRIGRSTDRGDALTLVRMRQDRVHSSLNYKTGLPQEAIRSNAYDAEPIKDDFDEDGKIIATVRHNAAKARMQRRRGYGI